MSANIAFLEVAEQLNFAVAATKLKVTPSTLSRNIKELESSIGTLLFYRTTRKVSLTEAGIKYYEYCKKGLEEFQKAEREIALLNSKPRGTLKIIAPICFAQMCVAPCIANFMARYPEVNVELDFYDAYSDNIDKEVDLVFKIGNLTDTQFTAKKLAKNDYIIVTSHKYIKENGTPVTPDQLIEHNCMTPGSSLLNNTWKLTKGGETRKYRVRGQLQSNSALIVYEAVLRGNGIALLPNYIPIKNIITGDLIQLLPAWNIPANNIYLMHASTSRLAPKIKAFIEYFSDLFTPQPPWCDENF